MYGSKGRIGLAVLDSDITIEPDLAGVMPHGVAAHVGRVRYPHEVTVEALGAAEAELEQVVQSLLPTQPASITWACTSGSFFRGREHHETLLAALARWSQGVPVTTASNAVVKALRALGVRRPAVGTPYAPDINLRLQHFLGEHGFETPPVQGLFPTVVDDITLQSVDQDEVFAFGASLDRPDADAIVISCTGLPTNDVAHRLEERLGKPVVTSNLAILWHACLIGGITAPHRAKGRLFAMEAQP
jgi:maleate isomerase